MEIYRDYRRELETIYGEIMEKVNPGGANVSKEELQNMVNQMEKDGEKNGEKDGEKNGDMPVPPVMPDFSNMSSSNDPKIDEVD